MRIWRRRTIIPVALSAAFLLVNAPAGAQSSDYRARRLPGTDEPDLNGIWQAVNSANWDIRPHAASPGAYPNLLGAIGAVAPGQGVIVGNELPYQLWAAEKQRENFESRLRRPLTRELNDTTGDPEAKCFLPGVPRVTYMPYPFQIVHTASQVFIAYEFASAARIIHMDSEPESPAESWMGWSIGHWEGDTLVVEVTDQVDRTWFDRAGNFHSNEMRVTERYTPLSPYHLQYEARIEDPNVFTRPWTISMPLYRRLEPDVQLMEFKCIEFAEPFLYEHMLDPSGESR